MRSLTRIRRSRRRRSPSRSRVPAVRVRGVPTATELGSGVTRERHGTETNSDRILKADHPLFDWLINCVILNHF